MKDLGHVCVPFFIAIALLLLPGCAVPVPAPPLTSAPPSIERIDGVDLSFLQPSVTTKAEVMAKLGWVNTFAATKGAFIGRWSTSSSKTIWFIGGPGAATGGEFRNWKARTIIIEFNDQQIVQSWHLVPDRDLVYAMRELAQRKPDPERFDTPVNLTLEHRYTLSKTAIVTVVLAKQSLHFAGRDNLYFEVPPHQIKHISIPKLFKSEEEHPDQIAFTIHFSDTTRAGNQITFVGSAADLMTLIEYQVQTSK